MLKQALMVLFDMVKHLRVSDSVSLVCLQEIGNHPFVKHPLKDSFQCSGWSKWIKWILTQEQTVSEERSGILGYQDMRTFTIDCV